MDALRATKRAMIMLPPVTRLHAILAVTLTLMSSFGIVDPRSLMFDTRAIVQKAQIHRVFTSAFYPGSLISLIFSLFFYANTSAVLEYSREFADRPGTFLQYTIVCQIIGACVCSLLFRSHVLHFYPIYRVILIYEWASQYTDTPVSLYGFRVEGRYLPLVSILFEVLMGGNPKNVIIAYIVAIGLHNIRGDRTFRRFWEATGPFKRLTEQIDKVTLLVINRICDGLQHFLSRISFAMGHGPQTHTVFNAQGRKLGSNIS